MLHGAVARRQPGAHFVRVVVERAHAATIGDAAGFVDDIEAFGPRGVSGLGGVVDVIDAKRDGILEALDEIVGDGHPLTEGLRLGVANVLLHVGFHLPFVCGMSFANVHGQKVRVIFVVVVNLHHVTDVAAEGRSSVATEDDDERSPAGSFADVEVIGTVESDEAGVGGVVADFERATVHVRQGIAHHAVSILGTSGHLAENEKGGKQYH